jgi:phosphoserine aminotransferase
MIMERIYNFSAGPSTLPESVLLEAQAELLSHQGRGLSIMEDSHRSKAYDAVHNEAIANIAELLGLPDDYAVLFLTGGATGQFAMVPMNLLLSGTTADYTDSGSWASKAIKEAKIIGQVHVAAACGKEIPTRVPRQDELDLTEGAAYLHITSNETISGAQWQTFPEVEAPLVADMSSDILSRPFDVKPFGLIYAGAQKNLGPAGVTLVIMRKDLAERVPETVPQFLRYKTHLEANSLYNTPPCFPIYMIMLVTRWLKAQGGLAAVEQMNRRKAALLYDAIDASDFYTGTAVPECRSMMNVTFRLPSEELEAAFVKAAKEQQMEGLKGHRSVGGIRASIYNAMPEAGVQALVDLMQQFERENG